MKHILPFMVIILISCNSLENNESNLTKKKTDNNYDNYDLIVNRELISNIKVDTIFMDFVFGLSEKNTESHIEKLIAKQRIQKKKVLKIYVGDQFVWDLVGYPYNFVVNDSINLETLISVDFYNDKLYKLVIHSVSDTPPQAEIKDFLTKIYGEPSYLNKRGFFLWIRGNRQIELTQGSSIITFTDLRLEKGSFENQLFQDSLRRANDIQKKELEKKATKNDFK